MSDIVSRWPVRLALPIDDSDRDAGHRLTEGAVDRIFAEAADAYFALCRTVDAGRVQISKQVNVAGVPVEGDHVTISVGVVEIYPDEFTLEARLRPAAGEGIAGQATRRYKVEGGVGEDMRDEFIALAHAARYTH
jgi:hypothetical protein